jgi:hypothetical protein
MANNYIPNPDGDFDTWQTTFYTYANANLAGLGLVAGDITPLTAARTAWTNGLANNATAQTAARAARETKDAARSSYEDLIRALVRRLQVSPAVDDAERRALGITVKDDIQTMTAARAAATRPVGVVDTGERMRHTIRFFDEATPQSRAKPDGVMGCEIWVKVADPAPADASELQFLTLDTASPYIAEYDGKAAGQKAHYMLRWVTTRGDKGPWSETVSATIPG